MTKFQLRAACRTAGITGASRMTNDQMREALAAHAQDNMQPSQMVEPVGNPQWAREYEAEYTCSAADDTIDARDAKRNESDVPAGTVQAVFQRTDERHRVVNNTPPRNRKGRRLPCQIRTAGRARRWHSRHLQPTSVSA